MLGCVGPEVVGSAVVPDAVVLPSEMIEIFSLLWDNLATFHYMVLCCPEIVVCP